MSLVEAKSYINQAREFPTLEWISFTGGEPFLVPELLNELVAYASSLGLRTECVTNGFWAHTERVALKQLSRLRAAGLEVVNISVDDFHQAFIPFDRIRHGFNAAKQLGLKVVIMCVISNSSELRAPEIIRFLGDDAIHILRPETETPRPEETTALLVESGFLPAGRATQLPVTERVLDFHSSFEGGCPFLLRDITIRPGGRVLACCSAGALTTPLDIGSTDNQNLLKILEAAKKRRLVKILTLDGPRDLFRRLNPNVQFERGKYVSKCHLCFELLSDPRLEGRHFVQG